MTTKRETAIRLVERCLQAEAERDHEAFAACYSPSHRAFMNGQLFITSGPDEGPALQAFAAAMPDYRREIQWQASDGDRVVAQYRLFGTHTGELGGYPGSGNRIEIHGLIIQLIEGDLLGDTLMFTDHGHMNRQLSGKVRPPGTASAAPQGPPIPEHECARYEEMGERLIRTVYASENEGDIEKQLACYADPLLDHFAGNAMTSSRALLRSALPAWWDSLPGHHRDFEEVLAFGNRAILRWHLTADDIDGKPVWQHGASVIEHDGTQIRRFWAYYPDVAQVFPAIVDR